MGDVPDELTPRRPASRRGEDIRSTRRPRTSRSAASAAAFGDATAPGPQEADLAPTAGTGPDAAVPEQLWPDTVLEEAAPPAAALDGAPQTAIEASPTVRLEPVQRDRAADDERRRQLWRDSATILIGVVLAILVGQAMFPASVAAPAASPTPLPSGINIGSFGPPVSLPPAATFGPILNPSLKIDATPTPIPVITMGPSRPPSPSPSPTKKPTPKPTAKVTAPPGSVAPTPEITAPPPPTEPPPTEPPPPDPTP